MKMLKQLQVNQLMMVMIASHSNHCYGEDDENDDVSDHGQDVVACDTHLPLLNDSIDLHSSTSDQRMRVAVVAEVDASDLHRDLKEAADASDDVDDDSMKLGA